MHRFSLSLISSHISSPISHRDVGPVMTGVHPGVRDLLEHHSPVRLFLARVQGLDEALLVLLVVGQGTYPGSVGQLDRLLTVHHQLGDLLATSAGSRDT